MKMHFNVLDITSSFNTWGEVTNYYPIGNGHINSTFLCETTTGNKYVLQKINNTVFKDVELLMSNYSKVTKYLRHHGFGSIHLIKSCDNKYYHDYDGYPYRLYEYIDNVICYEKIDNMDLVYQAANAFGKLHKALKGFDANELGEVIPNFHNTWQRYQNLLNAIKEDKLGRVKDCTEEINLVKSLEDKFSIVVDAIKNGEIPLAVTHNDPKINNVLFNKDTGEIRAVIDLDTVMPGSYLYDFGDALRSLFTGDNEDTKDLSKLVVNFEIFDAYAHGYLDEMKDVLTKKEKELLGFSSFLLSIECGMRFLEDYIRGDVYFKIARPDHNLTRARTQIALATKILKNLDKLNSITEKYLN